MNTLHNRTPIYRQTEIKNPSAFFTAEGENRYAAEKNRTNSSETGRQRREEKELTGAEYELPSEGAHTIFFVR